MLTETIDYQGHKIEIHTDENAQNPRTDYDSNMAVFALFHKRLVLGDKDHGYDSKDYSGWAEMEKAIRRKEKDIVAMTPVYMYDHSGITIASTPFSCPWDSGQIGFAFVTKRKIRENYAVKKVTKKQIERATAEMQNEIDLYDQYLKGEVYGFIIKTKGLGRNPSLTAEEIFDSCWGYYGNEAETEAKSIVDHRLAKTADSPA